MLKLIAKNIKNMFTTQKLISFILAVNIIVSCLVICFSSGLYSIYQPLVEDGQEITGITSVTVMTDTSNCYTSNNGQDHYTDMISPGKLVQLLNSLSDSTNNNISYISQVFYVKTPLSLNSAKEIDIMSRDDRIYDDSYEPYYWPIAASFRKRDGKIVDTSDERYFSYDQYNSGEKVIVAAQNAYNKFWTVGYTSSGKEFSNYFSFEEADTDGHANYCYARLLSDDTSSLVFGGESYKIIDCEDFYTSDNDCSHMFRIPITSMPEEAFIKTEKIKEQPETQICFTVRFEKECTRAQYVDVRDNVYKVMGDNVYVEPVDFLDPEELDYYNTILRISFVIALLSAINMTILYRYILEKRSAKLAVIRICGCTKGKAAAMYLAEGMIINVPLFILTELAYHMLILPRIERIYEGISKAYSINVYVSMFIMYIAIVTAVMFCMVYRLINKHSLAEIKNTVRVNKRIGVMDILEVFQLFVVFVLLIFIISAVQSRYTVFEPFEQYLSRKGYMVNISSKTANSPEDLIDANNGGECIINEFVEVSDGDNKLFCISYSDEFIEAYDPFILNGKWLDETDETYEDRGYIPAVVTWRSNGYNVGDVIESKAVTEYNDNGEPVKFVTAKYKIVGVLQDKTRVASYALNARQPKTYRDIFNTFSSEFDVHDWLLTRAKDNYACYGEHGAAFGTAFVFCDRASDREYEIIGQKLQDNIVSAPPVELSVIYDNSTDYIYSQLYSLLPIAVCILILALVSAVSVNTIYTKRHLRNYAIFYICGARWRSCALKSFKNSLIVCGIVTAFVTAFVLIGRKTYLNDVVITFSLVHVAACAAVVVLYLLLSLIIPLLVIGSEEPKEILKDE